MAHLLYLGPGRVLVSPVGACAAERRQRLRSHSVPVLDASPAQVEVELGLLGAGARRRAREPLFVGLQLRGGRGGRSLHGSALVDFLSHFGQRRHDALVLEVARGQRASQAVRLALLRRLLR